ncbi:MAG: threonine synthase [bacterium]
MKYLGIIDKYKQYLPITKKTPIISLQEGNTPLIEANNLTNAINKNLKIFLKYEGCNPTGSFKDRGMTLAVSKAIEQGFNVIICASTGNTSASASAYAARAGIKSVVLIPEGNIAKGKLAQALIYNAQVISIKGNFDKALSLVKEITTKYPFVLVNSLNPFRIEGQKTGAFEICDFLGKNPDYQFMPVGNAGNITAYWKGYNEYYDAKKIKNKPKMMGWQAKGSAPIVLGHPVKNPKTIATAIKIGNPASWQQALKAIKESNGLIDCVSDEEILNAYKMVAKLEGIFVEPASAAGIAGLIKLNANGFFNKPLKQKPIIVCILTGNGLKDPETSFAQTQKPLIVSPNLKQILKAISC